MGDPIFAKMDEEFGDAASQIRKKITEVITPIFQDLETRGKLRDKASKVIGHISDDAEGNLRSVWKYD